MRYVPWMSSQVILRAPEAIVVTGSSGDLYEIQDSRNSVPPVFLIDTNHKNHYYLIVEAVQNDLYLVIRLLPRAHFSYGY